MKANKIIEILLEKIEDLEDENNYLYQETLKLKDAQVDPGTINRLEQKLKDSDLKYRNDIVALENKLKDQEQRSCLTCIHNDPEICDNVSKLGWLPDRLCCIYYEPIESE